MNFLTEYIVSDSEIYRMKLKCKWHEMYVTHINIPKVLKIFKVEEERLVKNIRPLNSKK